MSPFCLLVTAIYAKKLIMQQQRPALLYYSVITYKISANNTNFYRIKVVNIDGSSEFSNSIKIASKIKDFDITIPSNVISNNQISLFIKSVSKGNLNYFLLDELGRILQSNHVKFQNGAQQNMININANLPKGIYYLKLIVENNTTPFVFKMIQ